MNERYGPPPSRPLRAVMIAVVIAFMAGLAAMGWALTHWSPAEQWLPAANASAAAAPDQKTAEPRADAPSIAPPAPAQGTVPLPSDVPPQVSDARIGALESRLAEIDRHAAASADQASRAEGLLIAFAARRAIDSGVVLGYLEAELNAHFGTTQPRAVANIIAAARAPTTLESLRIGLDALAPEADPNGARGDWWTRFRAGFGSLITIRRAGEASTAPDERLARARLALNTGAVQNALAEVARLPGGSATNAWMAAARRYIEAHNALDILEAAALTRQQPAKAALQAPKPASPTPAPKFATDPEDRSAI